MIRNAEMADKDAGTGTPVEWAKVNGTFGLVSWDAPEEGVVRVETRQLHSTASGHVYPYAKPTRRYSVDTSKVHTAAGKFVTIFWAAGATALKMQERNAAGTIVSDRNIVSYEGTGTVE